MVSFEPAASASGSVRVGERVGGRRSARETATTTASGLSPEVADAENDVLADTNESAAQSASSTLDAVSTATNSQHQQQFDDRLAETVVRSVDDDVTGVDEPVAEGTAARDCHAPDGVSCILCMECIGTTGQLKQHLLMVHKVKPETVKSILSLVRNADSRTSGVENSTSGSNIRGFGGVGGDKSQHCVTSHGRDTGSDDAARDVTGEGSSPVSDAVVDAATESRVTTRESCDALQDEQLRLATEASEDGIVIPETDLDLPDDADRLCQTCSETFASVDALYAHQNELGHLELTQTPTGPGYLCWQPGCQQYFRTARGVQSHHRDVHSSASEYRFRCTDCRMAFRSTDSLRAHAYCHSAAAAQRLAATSTPADVFQRKRDAATADASAAERERYRANLAAASSLALLGGEPSALEGFTAVGSAPRHGSGKTSPTTTAGDDTPPDGLRGRYIDDLKLDENYNSNLADTLMPPSTKDATLVRGVPVGDSEYAGLKFKCHRCKVGFAKMSQLSAHNRTPAHRQGARTAEEDSTMTPAALGGTVPPVATPVVGGQSLEKYRDPNRPFKCDVCRESFTQKNILLVHYNSVSHLHRLKQQQQLLQQVNADVSTCQPKDTISSDSTEENAPVDGPIKTEEESLTSTQGTTAHIIQNGEQGAVKDNDGRSERNSSVSAAVTSNSVPSTSGNDSLMTSFGGSVSATMVQNQSAAEETSPPATQSIQMSATTVPLMTSLQLSSAAAGVDRKLAPTAEDRSDKWRSANISGMAGSKQVETQPATLQSLQQQQQMQMFLSDMFQRQFLGSLMPTPDLLSGMFGVGSLATGHGDATKSAAAAGVAVSEPTSGARSQAVQPHHQRTCPHTCYHCGAIFGSAEHLHQHQLVQCPASGNATRVATTSAASRPEMPSVSASSANYKSRIQQVLLESIGFECVMQYNENRQKSRKNVDQSADSSVKPSSVDEEDTSQISANKEESTTTSDDKVDDGGDSDALKGGDLPELKRCTCTRCSKEFSSVWVLKAHEEEVHSTVLPINSVEEFARQLRIHYDSRQAAATTATTSSEPLGVRATKKTEPATAIAAAPSTSEASSRASRMSSGQLAADLAAMQHAAAQLMHLPLMMGMMGTGTVSGPATPAAATAGLLPMMLPLSPEFFGIPPTFPAAMMDPATMMMLSQQQQQQQQQQQRGLRTGTAAAPIPTNCAGGVAVAPPPSQPPKSARTRINDEQLSVLRAHFDINNSPSEEQIHAMSERTGLPPKVIKHWFRNTLFKERQRNKDSPYNFSVPPATTLNIDDYERTAPTAKRAQPDDTKSGVGEPATKMAAVSAPETSTADPAKKEVTPSSPSVGGRKMVAAPAGGIIPTPIFPTDVSAAAAAAAFAGMCQLPPVFSPMPCAPGAAQPPSNAIPSGVELHSHERRANRTRFTNHQIQVLQECFEKNAYPKDDELEALSRLLDLSPRVIVVWFQNARQKVRKSYESQASSPAHAPRPPAPSELSMSDHGGSLAQCVNGDPEYRCDRCSSMFCHYTELAAHRCYCDDAAETAAGDAAAGSEESDVSRDDRDGDGAASENDASQSSVSSEPRTTAPVDLRCDHCSASFGSLADWSDHQATHATASGHVTPSAPTTSGSGDDVTMKSEKLENQTSLSDDAAGRLWMSDDGGCDDFRIGSGGGSGPGSGNGSSSDKRMRTTILPEQLDYLYHKYQADCNPSRKQLDAIASHVGLKKRVVQVWFQNTRARERKGQYRAHQQLIHKRCPFCKALFRARTALEAHLATKHPDEMARSDVTVDSIPDELVDTAGMTSPVLPGGIASQKTPQPPAPNGPFGGIATAGGGAAGLAPFMAAGQVRPSAGPGDVLQANMQRLYEDSFRRYIDELSHASHQVKMEAAAAAVATSGFPIDFRGSEAAPPSTLMTSTPLKIKPEDAPLDLSTSSSCRAASSAIEQTVRGVARDDVGTASRHASSQEDARSESRSETNDDFSIDLSCTGDGNSNPASPGGPTGSATQAKPPPPSGTPVTSAAGFVPNKRYRTQMSSVQIRVMKTIFADYRTPTMSECEILGREISLPRRVVQVWFQNARAKEKKIVSPDGSCQGVGGGVGLPLSASVPDSCELCGVRYSSQLTVQDHLFTRLHVDRVKAAVCSQRDVSAEDQRHHRGGSDASQQRSRRYSSSKTEDHQPGGPRPAVSAGLLLTPPIAAVPSNSALTASALVSGANRPKLDTSSAVPKIGHMSAAASTPMSVNNSFNSSAAQILAPYAAAAAAASFPNDVLGMMPYFYPGLATAGYYPGAGIPFIQPPGLLPGQDNMFMLDPANFGTPLTLLQIPARSIQRIQEKLTDTDCTVTHYSQDCRHFSDIRKAVGSDDWTVARRATVDVGYICRRCHIVYPGRTACAGHQEAQCYRDGGAPNNAIMKLEQLQYECSACRVRTSTIAEYKTHCAGESHRKAAAAWIRVHYAAQQPASATPRPESDTPHAAVVAPTSTPSVFNRPTPNTSNQETKPEEHGEDPTSNSS